MRLLLRIVAVAIGVAAIVAAAGVAYLFARYPDVPPAEEIRVVATAEKLARGKYLSNHVAGCTMCHAVRDFTKYAAPVVAGSEGRGGDSFADPNSPIRVLYSPNISPTAIGSWTDGELIRAMTSGVSKDGTPLFPIMPYLNYGKLSRDDVESIVAYVRTLPSHEYQAPARELGMPLPLVVRTMPAAAAFRPIPSKSDRVAYGEYVTNAAACIHCHTPIDGRGQALPGMSFAGGFVLVHPGGEVRSANITPDATTGIGTWTEQQFIDKFKAFEGAPLRPLTAEEQKQNTVMPWTSYAGMTTEDLGAIYAYLRSLRPVIHRVPKAR